MNMKSKISVALCASVLFCLVEGRNNFAPSTASGAGLPYSYDPMEYSMPCKDLADSDSFDFDLMASAYMRGASQSYGNNCSTELYDLSNLFHGSDQFMLRNVFENSALPTTPFSDATLNAVKVTPSYGYNESGLIIEAAAQRNFELGERACRLRLTASMPVKRVQVSNKNSLNTLQRDYLDPVNSNWIHLTIQDGRPVFAARIDELWDAGLMEKTTVPPLPVDGAICLINTSIKIVSAAPKAAAPEMTVKDILAGKLLTYLGADYKINPATAYTVTDATTINVSGTDCTVSPLLPVANTVLVPIEFYGNVQPGLACKSVPLISLPKKITLAKPSINTGVYITDATTGELLGTPDPVAIPNSFYLSFYSYPEDTVGATTTPVQNISFNVPIVVQKTDGTFPKNYLVTAPDLGTITPDPATGLYQTWDANKNKIATIDKKTNFVDGVTGDFQYDAASGAPQDVGIFWWGTDYTGFLGGKANTLFITTTLDASGNETLASQALYTVLESYTAQQHEKGAENATYGYQTIEGWFANGYRDSQLLIQPKNVYDWSSFEKSGIGDCDIQCIFGSTWENNGLAADFILGMVAPTGLTTSPQYNYLATPLGNNGHFEYRLGAQGAYDINSWIRFSGYAHYSWALPSYETLLASYRGAKNFGLQPQVMLANVWWQEGIISCDLSCFANERTSIAMKYQYRAKRQDNIVLATDEGNNAFGGLSKLSASPIINFSAQRAHKAIGEVGMKINNDCTLIFGVSDVFAGRNVAKEFEGYASFLFEF